MFVLIGRKPWTPVMQFAFHFVFRVIILDLLALFSIVSNKVTATDPAHVSQDTYRIIQKVIALHFSANSLSDVLLYQTQIIFFQGQLWTGHMIHKRNKLRIFKN